VRLGRFRACLVAVVASRQRRIEHSILSRWASIGRLKLLERSFSDGLARSTLKASETALPDRNIRRVGDIGEASQWRFVGLLSSPMDRPYYQQILKEYRTKTPAVAIRDIRGIRGA
jgi:hypothetical protein